jgi:excisionase family DNA binding protein
LDVTEARDPWLAPAEAAERFGVTTRTLINWVQAGKLEAQRTVGGKRRYRESGVQALLKELKAVA